MRIIRCSSLPRAWACPASAEAPEGEIALNISDDASEVGTAFHRWIASHIQGTELDQAQLAREHGVDLDELGFLCHNGRKAWEKILPMLGEGGGVDTEQPVSCQLTEVDMIEGTADCLGIDGTETRAIVIDWKTGRIDAEYHAQLMGYALCALDDYEKAVEQATIITVWVRAGNWDVVHVSRAQVESWADQLRARLMNGSGTFNPGPACTYCPRAASCPGRRALVHATIQDWSSDALPIASWTPETRAMLGPRIGEAFAKAKMIERSIENFRALLKEDVATNGDLDIGAGRKLSLLTVNRRQIDVAKAREVLPNHLDQAGIDSATTISAGKLDDAVMAASERGKGASNKRALAAALEEAGAITLREEHQLREIKST